VRLPAHEVGRGTPSTRTARPIIIATAAVQGEAGPSHGRHRLAAPPPEGAVRLALGDRLGRVGEQAAVASPGGWPAGRKARVISGSPEASAHDEEEGDRSALSEVGLSEGNFWPKKGFFSPSALGKKNPGHEPHPIRHARQKPSHPHRAATSAASPLSALARAIRSAEVPCSRRRQMGKLVRSGWPRRFGDRSSDSRVPPWLTTRRLRDARGG